MSLKSSGSVIYNNYVFYPIFLLLHCEVDFRRTQGLMETSHRFNAACLI